MFLLLVEDTDTLELARPNIVAAATRLFQRSVSVFEEFKFVSATGYGERVIDEVEAVLSPGSEIGRSLEEEVLAFVSRWHLSERATQSVTTLSAGWRHFLSLALFLKKRDLQEGVVLFSPFHYLDIARSSLILEELRTFSRVLIVDFDVPRVKRISGDFQELILSGDDLTPVYPNTTHRPNANW